MHASDRPLAVGLLAATAALCLVLALVGAADGLPFLVPALLLAIPLATGLYVGEEALLALADGRLRRSRAPIRFVPSRVVAWRRPRGGGLIATSLAGRPPPAITHA